MIQNGCGLLSPHHIFLMSLTHPRPALLIFPADQLLSSQVPWRVRNRHPIPPAASVAQPESAETFTFAELLRAIHTQKFRDHDCD
jgi:hypothetical protein